LVKRGATLVPRAGLVLLGIAALAFMLWEPHLEGRNANATLFEIYFRDPFLAYAYLGSSPFFFGLYQAFRFLEFAGQNKELSPPAVSSVRTVKHCAMALIGFVVLGEVFIMLGESDDRAGGVFIGLLIALASVVVAAAMALLERALRNARERAASRKGHSADG
jgi:hypothetical protein